MPDKIAKKSKNRTGVYTRLDAEKKHYTEDYKLTDEAYAHQAKAKGQILGPKEIYGA